MASRPDPHFVVYCLENLLPELAQRPYTEKSLNMVIMIITNFDIRYFISLCSASPVMWGFEECWKLVGGKLQRQTWQTSNVPDRVGEGRQCWYHLEVKSFGNYWVENHGMESYLESGRLLSRKNFSIRGEQKEKSSSDIGWLSVSSIVRFHRQCSIC